ncbi:MAG: thioredoxin family protein [Planctomycetota bacterium]
MFQSLSVICLGIVGMFDVSHEWTNDYAKALDSARKAKRPMVVVLEDPRYSKLRADSLIGVKRDLLRQFEVCRVDATSNYGNKVAKLYGATQLPYAVVTDGECKNILFRGAGQFSSDVWNETLENYTQEKENSKSKSSDTTDQAAASVLKKKITDIQPFTHKNLKSALEASKERKVPALVVVSMNNCHFCDKLQDKTLNDDSVRQMIAEKFESVVIKKENHEEWVSKKDVNIYPTTLVVSPNGEVLDHIKGFVKPADMRARLRVIGSALYTNNK